jgi:hypothetical protein
MNALTQTENNALATGSASSYALLMDGSSLERLERIADLMASGKTTIPQHLRGSKGDCFAVVLQSMQWGMNPIAVAQKTHLVNGTLGYEGQLVAAVVNASKAVKDRFHFEWYGPWEKVIGKFIIKRGEKGEYRVPGWGMSDEEGCGIRVWATLKGEAEPRVLDLLLAQARVRNSTQWADDPKQQLAYLAQKKWARLYAPDVILGVYTPDELAEPGEKFMGMAEDLTPPEAPKPAYTTEQFAELLPSWRKAIAAGKATADGVLGKIKTKGTVTAEQEAAIRAPFTEAEKAAAKPPSQQVTDVQPKTEDAPAAPTAQDLEKRLRDAKDLDTLYAVADLIGEVPDPEQRAALTAVFEERQFALEAN